MNEQLTIDFERSRWNWRHDIAVRLWIADLRQQDKFQNNVQKRRNARLGRLGSDGKIAKRFAKSMNVEYTKST